MFKRILVPYDGSEFSREACAVAVQFSKRSGAKVRLVHHFDAAEFPNAFGYGEPVIRSAGQAARQSLEEAQARLREQGASVEVDLRLEVGKRLGASVADAAAEWAADLVVLGSHGRRGIARALLGSGAEQIVRASPVPSLVVRAGVQQDGPRRIVVAIDGSETSTDALMAALQLARENDATLRLFHYIGDTANLVMQPYAGVWVDQIQAEGAQVLAKAAEMARSAGIPAETALSTSALGLGGAAAEDATQWRADLVVVGTHGRRGVDRMLLGSGAEQVLRRAPVAVLVVPPGRAEG